MAEPRIIIVGAGPAGVRAAETLVEAGLRPVVIDEAARDGGQIYRRQPEGFTRPKSALYGTEAPRAEALHSAFDALKDRVDYRPRHLAWNVSDGHLHVVSERASDALPYDALIVASGATDRLMPVKGWHFAGTYSLGAAQIALKAQAAAIGRRVVFMGSGPLLHLVASQYVKAGAAVVAVLDTSPFSAQIKALPKLLARPDVLLKGLKLVAGLRFSGVPVLRGIRPVEIHGDAETGVNGVSIRLASGEVRRFDCDAVGLGYHLRPETQLADLARCDFAFDAATRQFRPRIDIDGRTSVSGVYLAGDGVLTQGADGAEISGRLAAFAALADAGIAVPEARIATLRQERARMERFREGASAGRKLTKKHPFEGIIPNMERRYRETDSVAVREELARYRSLQPCPDCGGTRLRRGQPARHQVLAGTPQRGRLATAAGFGHGLGEIAEQHGDQQDRGHRQAEAQRCVAAQGDDRGDDRAGHHHRHHRAAHQVHRRELAHRLDQRTAQAGGVEQGRAWGRGTTGCGCVATHGGVLSAVPGSGGRRSGRVPAPA